MLKLPHVNKKPIARNGHLLQTKKLGLEWTMNGLGKLFRKKSDPKNRKTYPADCRKIVAVDSNKHDWDWKNRYWKKKILVQKHFLSPIYFDGIS